MFIKLTGISTTLSGNDLNWTEKEVPSYVRVSNIAYFKADTEYTKLYFLQGEIIYLFVKETPEEILKLIQEAENGK